VRAIRALLDPVIFGELLVVAMVGRSLAALFSAAVFLLLGAMFRYVASQDHERVWRRLYGFFVQLEAGAQGKMKKRLAVMVRLFSSCAYGSELLWPTGPWMIMVQ
jgi:hypothetical protein